MKRPAFIGGNSSNLVDDTRTNKSGRFIDLLAAENI